MPACRLYNRQFFRWTHLKQHIESSACSALGGASNSRSPVPDAIPAQIRAPPTAQLPIFEGQNSQHTPLVQRQAFLAGYSNLEKWLAVTAVRRSSRIVVRFVTCGLLHPFGMSSSVTTVYMQPITLICFSGPSRCVAPLNPTLGETVPVSGVATRLALRTGARNSARHSFN